MIWGKPPRGQCKGKAWLTRADERDETMKARWLARSAFALMIAAAAVLIGFAELASLAMVAIGVIGACLILAGAYEFLARRGVLRWLAAGAARRALAPSASPPGMPAREVQPPQRAFVIMNPRSGGGKVAKFGLKEKAEALGAEVALLDGPGIVDVAAL